MLAYAIDIATNIENVLLFGVTQHASKLLLAARLGAPEVLKLCALIAVADWLAMTNSPAYARCSQRALLAQVVVSIFSNTLLTELANSPQTGAGAPSDWWSVLTVAHSTMILVVFAVLPSGAAGDPSTAYRSRMHGLFLFMYTENIGAQVQRVREPAVLAALALLVYAVVHVQARRAAGGAGAACSRIHEMLARASNMLAINCILSLAVVSSYSNEITTGLLVGMLLAFDIASSAADWFAEIRGYALWKSARYVQQLYDEQWRDAQLALAVCVLGLAFTRLRCMRQRAGTAQQTLLEMVVLVGVNVVVSKTTPDVEGEGAARGLVLLVVYLLGWDVLLGHV